MENVLCYARREMIRPAEARKGTACVKGECKSLPWLFFFYATRIFQQVLDDLRYLSRSIPFSSGITS